MMCNNPMLHLVNMNAYIKFGENLSICSQDIESKQNFGVNQGAQMTKKMLCNYPNLDHVNINAHSKLC